MQLMDDASGVKAAISITREEGIIERSSEPFRAKDAMTVLIDRSTSLRITLHQLAYRPLMPAPTF